ncbi:MAG: hypothetical protein IJS99_07225 [Synergistaceae bacterium]|nr:hypothetical protein [Synergistaceae bacterium]
MGGGQFTQEPSGRFIKSSILKLINNSPLKLTQGLQKRDIIHVEDIINIINRLIQANFTGFHALPIGTGESHSIREIIEFLHSQTHSKSILEFGAIPSRTGEPDTLADISWYDKINYKLKHSFFEGLALECNNS